MEQNIDALNIETKEDIVLAEAEVKTDINKVNLKVQRVRGRPPKLKKDMLEDAEIFGRLGFTDRDLCIKWNISIRTMTRWKSKNPELCLSLQQGRQKGIESMTKIVYNKGLKGDLKAAKYYLNNRSDNWNEKGVQVNFNQTNINAEGDVIVNNTQDIRNIINQYSTEKKQELFTFIKDFQKKEEPQFVEGLITEDANDAKT